MADWSLLECEWPPDRPYDPSPYEINQFYQEKPPLGQYCPAPAPLPLAPQYQPPPSPTLTLLLSPPRRASPTPRAPAYNETGLPRGDNPREIRNKAEKQRRDKLNHSISKLAQTVPTVLGANRKVDKTGVLRLTAHYLRSHQYVFGDSIDRSAQEKEFSGAFSTSTAQALLGLLKGFLLTTTYKGLVVVVSQNVQKYLGYSELDLLGNNIFNITHPDDLNMFKEQLMPKSDLLGPHGELAVPGRSDGDEQVSLALASEKRRFTVRFKKFNQRSEPSQYVMCYVEGTLRKSDRACRGYNRCCQMVRRARARGDNPCSSGNDVVFIGIVRPISETFMSDNCLESFKMEYRTRHSVDGEIIQCEQRIALVTGYMINEVNGVNAMNFMHRDDVHWVIIALREMYNHHQLFGESCYRLMTKTGQFIYMRTRGRLDVEEDSRAVRSFVCTNTVVEEQEGRHLIRMMKKKFMMMVNNNEQPPADDEIKKVDDNQTVPIEDPRQLEKVILHLVTNLPSPHSQYEDCSSNNEEEMTSLPLAIIPPKKERIVGAIEKIYSLIKTFRKTPTKKDGKDKIDEKVVSEPKLPENDRATVTVITSDYESESESLCTVPATPRESSSRPGGAIQECVPLPTQSLYTTTQLRRQFEGLPVFHPENDPGLTMTTLQNNPLINQTTYLTNPTAYSENQMETFLCQSPSEGGYNLVGSLEAGNVQIVCQQNAPMDESSPGLRVGLAGVKRRGDDSFVTSDYLSKRLMFEALNVDKDDSLVPDSPAYDTTLADRLLDEQFTIEAAINSLPPANVEPFTDMVSEEIQGLNEIQENGVEEKLN